jgi:hypothetical protein
MNLPNDFEYSFKTEIFNDHTHGFVEVFFIGLNIWRSQEYCVHPNAFLKIKSCKHSLQFSGKQPSSCRVGARWRPFYFAPTGSFPLSFVVISTWLVTDEQDGRTEKRRPLENIESVVLWQRGNDQVMAARSKVRSLVLAPPALKLFK